jgi:serine protease AprX
MGAKARIIVANVILRSSSGKSAVHIDAEVSPKNVREFMPTKESVEGATRELKELGFQIDLAADTHISISGSRRLFEEVFQMRLKQKSAPLFKQTKKDKMKKSYYESTVPAKIPPRLSKLVEAVLFPVPPTYLSSPTPPLLSYDHIEVPEDVARDMDALKAHSRNITGTGIVIAMVDSGFMTPFHPYYAGKPYNIQPIVADPSDPSPSDDFVGHGTGIAACALAVAPGVTFIPVKPNFDPRDVVLNMATTFTRAVQQNPHIITCSWTQPFDPVLRLAINNAVSNGIVVLFASGNEGIVGWPGSEPAVISVGGAFMMNDDTIKASSFASSGENPNNPGRQCPDLCGLTGEAPRGIYIAMPTQPGSWFDEDFSGGVFPDGDETALDDGWWVASGTSTATPMVAGVVALLMQANPTLVGNPTAVRLALTSSCIDVTNGLSASGEAANIGQDLATGAGLVQAYRAVNTTDIFLRDNLYNLSGLVPIHNRRPSWPPYNHWTSHDIKVFSAPLSDPNAEYYLTPEASPIFGQTSYIYVRVRNRGTQPTGLVSIRLYYADPGTNLVFPTDWKDGQSGMPGEGTLTVNGIATNLQTTTNLAPGSDTLLLLPFEFQPPNPTTATQIQTLPDGRIKGHFCLLVRAETADDPITVPAGTEGSVINENNIAMKNVGVYSGPPSARFREVFFIRGGIDKAKQNKNDLVFDLGKLPKRTEAILQIRNQILRKARLVHAVKKKEGVHLLQDKERSAIYDLNLKLDEKVLLKLFVKFPSDVMQGDYHIPIMQISDGKAVGGIDFICRITREFMK